MFNTIGQRIKERRKELNITQTQIHEKTGISSGNLSGIENGKYLPSTSALLELSKILECSIDWMLTGESLISKSSTLSDFPNGSPEHDLLLFYHGMSDSDKEDLLLIAEMKFNKEKSGEKLFRSTSKNLA